MDEAERLRVALDRERAKRGEGSKGAFSEALRERVVGFIQRERARGRTVEDLSCALDVVHLAAPW